MVTKREDARKAFILCVEIAMLLCGIVWVFQISKAVDTINHVPMCTLPPAH